MIPQELIEKALQLTNTKYSSMDEEKYMGLYEIFGETKAKIKPIFSYPKFFYYLISPEFIKKYSELDYTTSFGVAINRYQSGNSEPIISLLQKIQPGTKQ